MKVKVTPKLDFLGRKIKPGDLIVYPVRVRSTLFMKKATVIRAAVIEFRGKEVDTLVIEKENGRTFNLINYGTSVVIERDFDGTLKTI